MSEPTDLERAYNYYGTEPDTIIAKVVPRAESLPCGRDALGAPLREGEPLICLCCGTTARAAKLEQGDSAYDLPGSLWVRAQGWLGKIASGAHSRRVTVVRDEDIITMLNAMPPERRKAIDRAVYPHAEENDAEKTALLEDWTERAKHAEGELAASRNLVKRLTEACEMAMRSLAWWASSLEGKPWNYNGVEQDPNGTRAALESLGRAMAHTRGKQTFDKAGVEAWADMIRIAAQSAVARFSAASASGILSDGLFSAAGFGIELCEMRGMSGGLDGGLVAMILSGRSDVMPMPDGAHYRLLGREQARAAQPQAQPSESPESLWERAQIAARGALVKRLMTYSWNNASVTADLVNACITPYREPPTAEDQKESSTK